MEKLKIEKEMEKTKALLDVVEESVEFESDEDEEKISPPRILSDVPGHHSCTCKVPEEWSGLTDICFLRSRF